MGKYTVDHTEYYNTEGNEIPSVTTVLKLLNKPALQQWANSLGFRRRKVKDVLDESASIGSLMHEALEYLNKGKIDEFNPKFKYPDEPMKLAIRLDSYRNWAKDHNIEPIELEETLSCEKFGGTIDNYCKLDGKFTVMDYKSSKAPYSSMFLQLGAYTYLEEEVKGRMVEQVAILNINNSTIFTVKTRKEIQPYIDAFLKLTEMFNLWYELNIKDGWGAPV